MEMTMKLKLLAPLSAAALLIALAACKPEYPKCENDDHCKEKSEVCINGQCQECRDDTQCAARGPGFSCNNGRCEQPLECRGDGDCKDGRVCRGNKCVGECTTNEDCPTGKRCDSERCVGECSSDAECGSGMSCVDGSCQAAQTEKISAKCRPMSGGAGEVIALPNIEFNFNDYELTFDSRQGLDQAGGCMREAPQVRIIIEGHGDERGTQEFNLALGEKRANTVKTYLKNLGVDTSRMSTRSKGENEPLCREASEECYSRNRRVEFIQSVR
jgi:peptidoglycan-associated lipoprotein